MRILILFTFFITNTLANELPNLKNLVVHKNPKTYSNVIFLDNADKEINIQNLDNQLIMLNFWATWCAPCKEEMPHLDKLKSKSTFQDLEIIPINIADEELVKSKEFFEEIKIKNLEIFYGPSIELAKVFKLRGVPTTILIDKEGYEFARVIGFIDFENKLFLDWLFNQL